MDWSKIAEIALSALTAAGGIGVISLAVIKWGSNIIADKLSKKYQFKIDKEIEKYKATISQKQHVSVTHFDFEFSLYKDLCKTLSDMLQDIFTIIPVCEEEQIINKIPMSDEALHKSNYEMFCHAVQVSAKAKDTLSANRPFLPKDIMDQIDDILALAGKQLIRFSERYNDQVPGQLEEKVVLSESDFANSRQLADKWFAVCDSIRNYLKTLEIV